MYGNFGATNVFHSLGMRPSTHTSAPDPGLSWAYSRSRVGWDVRCLWVLPRGGGFASAHRSCLLCEDPSHTATETGMQVGHQEGLCPAILSHSKVTVPVEPPRADLADRPPTGQIQAGSMFGLALEVFSKNVNLLPTFEIPGDFI